jgi:hypothetical protein
MPVRDREAPGSNPGPPTRSAAPGTTTCSDVRPRGHIMGFGRDVPSEKSVRDLNHSAGCGCGEAG